MHSVFRFKDFFLTNTVWRDYPDTRYIHKGIIMKKFFLLLIMGTSLAGAAIAADKISFEVDGAKKAEIDKKIAQYQADSSAAVKQAEADIKQAEQEFAAAKKQMEDSMDASRVAIQKAQLDAQAAKDRFEKVQADTNARIDAANARMQQASKDLTSKLEALKKETEIK